MHCPFCRHPDSRVVDSREADEGQAIRRRRSCPECGRRFTTVETAVLAVVKRSGVTGGDAPVPGRLAVIQVQTGETLQQVAHRVAPDAPVGQVVERIRELNQLDSAALDAGQTLIAPIDN